METPKTDTTNGNTSLAQGIAQVGSTAHHAIDRASDAARPAVDRIASTAHQAVDKAKDMAGHAADTLSAQADHLKDAKENLTQACSNYVRSNPVMAFGIALGIGFVMSRIMSSK